MSGFAEDIKLEELRLQFDTNFFGAVAVAKLSQGARTDGGATTPRLPASVQRLRRRQVTLVMSDTLRPNGRTVEGHVRAAERAPQVRMAELLNREAAYLEGMRLPAMPVVWGSEDYWRIYEQGVVTVAESYREDHIAFRLGSTGGAAG